MSDSKKTDRKDELELDLDALSEEIDKGLDDFFQEDPSPSPRRKKPTGNAPGAGTHANSSKTKEKDAEDETLEREIGLDLDLTEEPAASPEASLESSEDDPLTMQAPQGWDRELDLAPESESSPPSREQVGLDLDFLDPPPPGKETSPPSPPGESADDFFPLELDGSESDDSSPAVSDATLLKVGDTDPNEIQEAFQRNSPTEEDSPMHVGEEERRALAWSDDFGSQDLFGEEEEPGARAEESTPSPKSPRGRQASEPPPMEGMIEEVSREVRVDDRTIEDLLGPAPSAPPPFALEDDEGEEHSMDFDVFANEVDKGIDNLFTPRSEASGEEEEAEPSETGAPLEAPAQEPAIPVPEEPVEEPVMVEPPLPEARPGGVETRLQELMESLKVAYLSLEWEFSANNIRELQENLSPLEAYAQKTKEARIVFNTLKEALRHLRPELASISNAILKFIREAMTLMEVLLPVEEVTDLEARKQLASLARQFKELREQIAAVKMAPPVAEAAPTAPPEPQAAESPPPTTPAPRKPKPRPEKAPAPPEPEPTPAAPPQKPKPEPPAPPPPPPEVERPLAAETPAVSAQGLEELGKLLEKLEGCRQRYHESVKRLKQEKGHVTKLEGVLGKNKSLAPILTFVKKLGVNLESHSARLHEVEQEWTGILQKLREVESRLEARAVPAHVPPDFSGEALETPLEFFETKPEEAAPESPPQQEKVYRFTLSGKRFAVPADQVVKMGPVSPKKTAKILKRGHATLADFKPFLGSPKKGIIGDWIQKMDQLKNARFTPASAELLLEAPAPSFMGAQGFILVSDGRHYGIVFTDMHEKDRQEDTVTLKNASRKKHVRGIFVTESGQQMEVLEFNRVFSPRG